VKLSKELSRRSTGRTLYILDEPTTGLHFDDVRKLLDVLHELVAQGNSVVVIEHNLEVIKTADWIVDLGPEGGDGGGEIVAAGTPEDVAKVARSHTGQFLKPLLKRPATNAEATPEAAGTRSKKRARAAGPCSSRRSATVFFTEAWVMAVKPATRRNPKSKTCFLMAWAHAIPAQNHPWKNHGRYRSSLRRRA
jgi:ABC-type multidrug transport system ATPase subunit